MAEYPYMPLWTDSYLADTRHLTAQQHGMYMLLLMTAWRRRDCSLPDDDEALARWAAVDMRTWRKNKSIVMEFFNLNDSRWTQKRLAKERKLAEEVRERRVAAGRARHLKNKDKSSAPAEQCSSPAPAYHNHNHYSNQPIPSSYPPRGPGGGFENSTSDEARNILETYAKLVELHFANRHLRAYPHHTDAATAQGWIDSGGTDRTIAPVLQAELKRLSAKGSELPVSVSYFDKPVRRAIAADIPPSRTEKYWEREAWDAVMKLVDRIENITDEHRKRPKELEKIPDLQNQMREIIERHGLTIDGPKMSCRPRLALTWDPACGERMSDKVVDIVNARRQAASG